MAVFECRSSRAELEQRIRAQRGQDSEDEIHRPRLERAREESVSYGSYDFARINDDLERAGREVQAVIALGSRCRVATE